MVNNYYYNNLIYLHKSDFAIVIYTVVFYFFKVRSIDLIVFDFEHILLGFQKKSKIIIIYKLILNKGFIKT